MDKAELLNAALQRFAGGDDAIASELKRRTAVTAQQIVAKSSSQKSLPTPHDFLQVFCADGERAEGLSARIAKAGGWVSGKWLVMTFVPLPFQERGYLPNLSAIMRCSVHSSIRGLENCLKADPRVEELVQLWILQYSSDKEHGGFCRAIRNSCKLRANLRAAQEKVLTTVDQQLSQLASYHFAAQRFNTIVELSQTIILNIRPILSMLLQCVAEQGRYASWAQKLLDTAMCSRKLVLLALIAEFADVACQHAHSFDNIKVNGQRQSTCARTASALNHLELRLRKLFSFRNGNNELQEPLVLNPGYQSGWLQTLQREVNLLEDQGVTARGKLVFWKTGAKTGQRLKTWVAQELGTLENVSSLYLQGLKVESDLPAASSLQPLDLEWWSGRSDDSLRHPQFVRCLQRVFQTQGPRSCDRLRKTWA